MNLNPKERAQAGELLAALHDRQMRTDKNLREHVDACGACWRESTVRLESGEERRVMLFCEDGLALMTRRTEAHGIYRHFEEHMRTVLGIPT